MYIKRKVHQVQKHGKEDTRGGLGAVGIENWILQNGGSFETAARSFLNVAERCNNNFDAFCINYAIWDFGENHMVDDNIYPHDNFVLNMTEEGFEKMTVALQAYVKDVEKERSATRKSLGEIVHEDPDPFLDTMYMKVVEDLMSKAQEKLAQGPQVIEGR